MRNNASTGTILIDSNTTCPLECRYCARQHRRKDGLKPSNGNHTMTLDELKLLATRHTSFSFNGQMSDPIFNPHILDMLSYLHEKGARCSIHTAATSNKFKLDWYKKAFCANPNAEWVFGMDGLPGFSEFHRVNQDSSFLWEVMSAGAKMGIKVVWQYILFSYNEHDINEAREMANEAGISLQLVMSSRFTDNDILKPKMTL